MKVKVSFKYECEEECNAQDIVVIRENLKKFNLEKDIKDKLDEYLLDTDEPESKILDYKLEFTEE